MTKVKRRPLHTHRCNRCGKGWRCWFNAEDCARIDENARLCKRCLSDNLSKWRPPETSWWTNPDGSEVSRDELRDRVQRERSRLSYAPKWTVNRSTEWS